MAEQLDAVAEHLEKHAPTREERLVDMWAGYPFAEDYRHARVELRQRWYNRNYVGTHFGGSLFAMTDPF